jgi:hypothetical protein
VPQVSLRARPARLQTHSRNAAGTCRLVTEVGRCDLETGRRPGIRRCPGDELKTLFLRHSFVRRSDLCFWSRPERGPLRHSRVERERASGSQWRGREPRIPRTTGFRLRRELALVLSLHDPRTYRPQNSSLPHPHHLRCCCPEEAPPPDAGRIVTSTPPLIPDDAVACRFLRFGKATGIFIDAANGQAHFQNCHTPRGFLTSKDDWFSCPITDVVRVHHAREGRAQIWCLTIVTRVGGAAVARPEADYSELHETFTRLIPCNDAAFLMHSPSMRRLSAVFIACAGCLGAVLGWWALPENSSDLPLAIYMTTGCATGVVGSIVLTTLADRVLQSQSGD